MWLTLRYILPLGFPFLLGAGIALLAEPVVGFLHQRFHFPRGLAAGIGVTATVSSLCVLVLMLCGILLRELSNLTRILPDLENAARSGIAMIRDWLNTLIVRCPAGIRLGLEQNVEELFSSSSALIGKCTQYILGLAGTVITHVPSSALNTGTAILAGFMISAKSPQIRHWMQTQLPSHRLQTLWETGRQLRSTAGKWLLSQLKLSAITFCVLLAGFLLLRVSYAPFAAFLVALVDAFPVLGTGSILVPWSLFCLLQQDGARAAGLLGLYITAAAVRTMMEPRLVGQHLGLDPLATLFALYSGYRLWGLPGMLFMPMLASSAMQLLPDNELHT